MERLDAGNMCSSTWQNLNQSYSLKPDLIAFLFGWSGHWMWLIEINRSHEYRWFFSLLVSWCSSPACNPEWQKKENKRSESYKEKSREKRKTLSDTIFLLFLFLSFALVLFLSFLSSSYVSSIDHLYRKKDTENLVSPKIKWIGKWANLCNDENVCYWSSSSSKSCRSEWINHFLFNTNQFVE